MCVFVFTNRYAVCSFAVAILYIVWTDFKKSFLMFREVSVTQGHLYGRPISRKKYNVNIDRQEPTIKLMRTNSCEALFCKTNK